MDPASSPFPLLQAFTKRFEALDSTHPLYTKRQQAWDTFQEQGLPALKAEAYKYTPITDVLNRVFDKVHTTQPVQLPSEEATSVLYHHLDAYHVVLLNGQLSRRYSQLGDLEASVQLLTFEEAYQQHQEHFLQHFAQYDQHKTDSFAALNAALFEEGTFIHLAEHVILEKPLLLYHITDAHTQQAIVNPRILIFGSKNSQASIITSWFTLGEKPSFTNAMIEITVEQSACMDYYTLQTQPGPQAYHVNIVQCQQAQQSVLNAYTFTWGGTLVRNNLEITINASHTETNMYGLYYLCGQQHVDNHTQVDHRRPHTYSNELYKGIIAGEATGVFNGSIYVQAESQKTNAFQANENLILSDQATIHTQPQLEIWADDVKCSHGATTGQLDTDQLFYLRTRGLQQKAASQLLLRAFASEVMNKVPLYSLREHLHSHLEARLIQEADQID